MEYKINEEDILRSKTRILSSAVIKDNYGKEIEELLIMISRKENVSIKAAAVALANVLQHIMTRKDMHNE